MVLAVDKMVFMDTSSTTAIFGLADQILGDHQRFLANHHILRSMSASGYCADNAEAEGFFAIISASTTNAS